MKDRAETEQAERTFKRQVSNSNIGSPTSPLAQYGSLTRERSEADKIRDQWRAASYTGSSSTINRRGTGEFGEDAYGGISEAPQLSSTPVPVSPLQVNKKRDSQLPRK